MQEVAPFQFELLEFLRRDVEERCAEKGPDFKMQGFIQALHGPLPLEDILASYHTLFETKEPLHLEKTLMEALPVKDFIDLGLTHSYPRVYRGLPRLYDRNFPAQSYIKKNFVHLPSLKKTAVSKALFSLYGKLPAKGKVTLFTWVISDGLGDFVAAIEAMRMLHGRLPELDLHFIGLVQEKSYEGLVCPDNATIISYEGECPPSLIPRSALDLLRSSDVILQMPTFYPHTAELIELLKELPSDSPMPKMERVGEYGFLESSWFHPKAGSHSLGLHFLEKGILIRKPCQASWSDVRNEKLLQWRIPENHFYLAYLGSPIGGAVYLHALLKSLENDPKGIDLCVPDLGWFVQFVEKQNQAGRPVLEWNLGVHSIEVHFQDEIHSITLAPQGKKVRLLCPGMISQSDFRVLLTLSGDWVAIRGDQSFSEAVSQGKTFFYDARPHACFFMKDLLALAENRIGNFPSALTCIRGMNQAFHYNLPLQEGQWVDETFFQDCDEWTSIALSIGLALQDPEISQGFTKLNRIIAEEHSANGFLCHLIQRALCHHRRPDLEQMESQQLSLFISKEQTFSQLIKAMKGLL